LAAAASTAPRPTKSVVWSAVTPLVSVSIASAVDSHRLEHALVRDAGSLARQPHVGLVPLEKAEDGLVRRDENGAEEAELVSLPTQLARRLLSASGHGGELDGAHPRPVALDEVARLAFVPGHGVDATSAAPRSNRAFPYGSVGGRFVCGEALPPHTLENVGVTEIHVIGVEVKTG
jgi:hypothetical protein